MSQSIPAAGTLAIAGPAEPTRSARWAMASLSLAALLSSLGTSIANVSLPTLARAFGASFQSVQWAVLGYLLAITTLIVGVGRLGDLLGRRRLLLIGMGTFTGASVLCALAPTLGALIAARAVQGIGAATMMSLTMAFVGDAVPKPGVGRAMGLLGTMSAVGTALGPSAGGILVDGFGWPAIFLINAPIGLTALLLARRHLPPDRPVTPGDRGSFDLAGTALLAWTLGSYALAMTIGRGHFAWFNVALLGSAGVGFGLFLRRQRSARAPLIQLAVLRDRTLSAGLAMSGLVATVMMATLIVGPFYVSRGLGLGAVQVGLITSIGPLVAALSGVPAGRAVDRVGASRATVAGLLGIGAGALLLSLLPTSAGVIGYLIAVVVATSGYATFQVANNTAIMTDIGAGQRGVVAGLLSLSRNLGLVTGAAAMGAIFAAAAGATDVTSADAGSVARGMRVTFAVASLLIVGALALSRGQRGSDSSR